MYNSIAMQIVGSNIKRLRVERGWSQTELGKRIGVGLKTIARYEKATSGPSFHNLDCLAEVFGVSIGELFEQNDGDMETKKEDFYTLACQLMKKEIDTCYDNFITGIFELRKRELDG